MEADRTATVLIAEPSAEAKRHDEARKAVTQAVMSVADSTGGILISTRGGKLVLRFATADAAACAASKIHAAIGGVQIGFHTGPAAPTGGLADDTVSLALALLQKAQGGQTVTSQQTAERLNPAFREFTRSMLSLEDEASACELASWHQKGVRPAGWTEMAVLRLAYLDQLAVCSREKDTIVIGREPDCDLVVLERLASRHHCTVRHHGGEFTVHDHSRNGTYLLAADAQKKLERNGALLPAKGAIAIGAPAAGGANVIQFALAVVA